MPTNNKYSKLFESVRKCSKDKKSEIMQDKVEKVKVCKNDQNKA